MQPCSAGARSDELGEVFLVDGLLGERLQAEAPELGEDADDHFDFGQRDLAHLRDDGRAQVVDGAMRMRHDLQARVEWHELDVLPARSLDHESCGKLGEFLIWGASGKRALARRGRYVKRWCGAR